MKYKYTSILFIIGFIITYIITGLMGAFIGGFLLGSIGFIIDVNRITV